MFDALRGLRIEFGFHGAYFEPYVIRIFIVWVLFFNPSLVIRIFIVVGRNSVGFHVK